MIFYPKYIKDIGLSLLAKIIVRTVRIMPYFISESFTVLINLFINHSFLFINRYKANVNGLYLTKETFYFFFLLYSYIIIFNSFIRYFLVYSATRTKHAENFKFDVNYSRN